MRQSLLHPSGALFAALSLLSILSSSSTGLVDAHGGRPMMEGMELLSPRMLLPRQQPELTHSGKCGKQDSGPPLRCPQNAEEAKWITGSGTGGDFKCCSSTGYCGGTQAHCGTGCQSNFGTCLPPDKVEPPATDMNCGPKYGNRKCPSPEMCCSSIGYCGTGPDYCKSPDCLIGFGLCDASQVPKGDNTSWVDRTRPSISDKDEYGIKIYKCKNPGEIALTYDDGPYTYTDELLDILEDNDIKATFFVTGVNIGKGAIDDPKFGWDKVIKKMYQAGHQIASHTWSHADLDKLSEWDRRNEMIKLEMALRNIIGAIPAYMRPPYSSCGETCLKTMKDLGYHVIYFDLNTEDYENATPILIQKSKDIFRNALSPEKADIKKTSYLSISHDLTWQSAVNLTTFMVGEMKKSGWKGVTVGDCLGYDEPDLGAGAWYRFEETKEERDKRMKEKLEKGDDDDDDGDDGDDGNNDDNKGDNGGGNGPSAQNNNTQGNSTEDDKSSAPQIGLSQQPWTFALVAVVGWILFGF